MTSDILISGGGIAGPALAYWLVRHGHTVMIVEQTSALRRGGQAVDFRGPSMTVLKKMGILDQVREQATNMGPRTIVDAKGREIAHMPPEVFGGELEILWGNLAHILHDSVQPDVEYRFGTRITALHDDGQSVAVAFSDGTSASYDLVFGADGLHSATRAQVFGPEEQFVTDLNRYFTFFAMDNHLRLDHRAMAIQDGARSAVIQGTDPDKPARAMLSLTDPSLEFNYRDTEGNKRLFAERLSGLGWEVPTILETLAKTEDPYFDSIAQVHMESYARGRVCLIGDAAWCASPRSGMGTSLAIVGSYVLAHELLAANGSHHTAFARFHRLLQPYVARCQQLAIDSLKMDSPDSPLGRLIQRVGLWSLRVPGVGRLVARQSLTVGRSFQLPHY